MAIVNKLTFWFYVAMFYKMSMLPYLLSPFYLIYLLFKIDILEDGYSLSHVFWLYVICVILFFIIAAVEYNPKMISKVIPSGMIPNSQGMIDQHRLWMTFTRYAYIIMVYYFLTKMNMDFKACRATEKMAICNTVVDSFLLHNSWIILLLIALYWTCAFFVKSFLDVKRV
ncbi:hypothetical protein WA171_003579, partial [Blastocystis sp. BT1]